LRHNKENFIGDILIYLTGDNINGYRDGRNTFLKKENVEDYAKMHFKELEKFNEQISKVIRESEKA